MRVQKVVFPKNLRASFTRVAKKAFPVETFAICLGTKSSEEVNIEALFYPEAVELGPDGLSLSVDISQFAIASVIAKEAGLTVCACLHSHPWDEKNPITDATPSEFDWDQPKAYPSIVVQGICAVTEYGGKLHARYRFWPFFPPIQLE